MVLGKRPDVPLAKKEPLSHRNVVHDHRLVIRNANVIEPDMMAMAHAVACHALTSDEYPVGAIDEASAPREEVGNRVLGKE